MKQPYENLPRVWAWDENKAEGVIGYLVADLGGACGYPYVVYFNNDKVNNFINIEPYKEPTKRPMTHTEVFKMMQDNLSKGLMTYFKFEDGDITTEWHNGRKINRCAYSTDLENWKPLEVEE